MKKVMDLLGVGLKERVEGLEEVMALGQRRSWNVMALGQGRFWKRVRGC